MSWVTFISVPQDVTIWQVLNSQFLTSLLAAYLGYLLLRFEKGQKESTRTQSKIAQNLSEVIENNAATDEAIKAKSEVEQLAIEAEPVAASDIVAPPNGLRNDKRNDLRQLFATVKEYLERKRNEDGDQRHQRTYNKISGHYPAVLAQALYERGQIPQFKRDAAVGLFRGPYENGRVPNVLVSEAEFERAKKYSDQILRLI